jgi:predicted AAA+ superfamily ATPase
MVNAYLLKDILAIDGVKNASKLHNLLKLIAYQIGSEVSLDEIGKNLSISRNSVARYLDLLQKAFVVFPLGGYSSNLRKEVTKSSKWYFYDNGIRNALLNDFKTFKERSDQERGALWENFIIGERLKRTKNNRLRTNQYFWRTYDKQEIDLIEEDNKLIKGFEMKAGSKVAKVPMAFARNYPNATFETINRENFLNYI